MHTLAPQVKHVGYRYEGEYRLILQRDSSDAELQHRAAGTEVVRFTTVPIIVNGVPLLRRIRIGPARGGTLEAESASLTEVAKMLDESWPKELERPEVDCSRIPVKRRLRPVHSEGPG